MIDTRKVSVSAPEDDGKGGGRTESRRVAPKYCGMTVSIRKLFVLVETVARRHNYHGAKDLLSKVTH